VPDPVAEVGKGQHRAEHLGAKGRTDVGVGRGAAAQDAAEVEHVDHVAHGDALGHFPGVAPQRAARAERPREHVAGAERDHAAREILDGVVGGLVLENAHREDVAFAGGNRFADDDVRREPCVLGRGCDPVETEAGGADHYGDP
jgi:hypothetical protein